MYDLLKSLKLAIEDVIGCVYALTMFCGLVLCCLFLILIPGMVVANLIHFMK
jgi:hypothetical protein